MTKEHLEGRADGILEGYAMCARDYKIEIVEP